VHETRFALHLICSHCHTDRYRRPPCQENRLMKLQSWGRFPTMDSTVYTPASLPEMRGLLQSQSSFNGIARGLGRSYGDSALADQVVRSTRLDHFLGFNPETGLLRCSAGTSLADILRHFAPQGWFLPVLPGTRFVTVGGAIASDV